MSDQKNPTGQALIVGIGLAVSIFDVKREEKKRKHIYCCLPLY